MTVVLMKGDTERCWDSYAQRKDHMGTRGEGSHRQDKETGLRETKPDDTSIMDVPASRL